MRKSKKTLAILAIIAMVLMLIPVQAFASTTSTSNRLAGQDRIDTAIQIANNGWASGASTVIVAPADDSNLVDALAVAPLAAQLKAPILVTYKNSLSARVQTEISTLKATTVYAVGALSSTVVNQLKAISGVTVTQIQGSDRTVTTADIDALLTNPAGTFVVGYNGMPDALSAASYAAANNYAIVVANPDGTVPAAEKIYGSKTYILGGPTLVNDITGATRLYGADRYATNDQVITNLTFKYAKVYVANGDTLVDALAGAPLAAMTDSPIILGNTSSAPAATDVNKNLTSTSQVIAFGGTGVVPDSVLGTVVYTAPATVTVTVSSVSAINARQVKVVFSGPVDSTSATTVTNYTINGANPMANGAVLQSDNKTVILTLAAASKLTNPSTNNIVTVANVKDTATPLANTIATQTFTNVSYSSSTLPTAQSVTIIDPTHVQVFFSEPVGAIGPTDITTQPSSNFITVDNGVIPASGAISTTSANPINSSVTFTLITSLTVGQHTLSINANSLYAFNGLAVLPTNLTFNYAPVTGSPTATVVSATPTDIRVQFNRPVRLSALQASQAAGDIYAGYASNTATAVAAVDTPVTGDYSTTYDLTFNTMLGSSITLTIANNTTTPIQDGFGNLLTTQTLTANITIDTTVPIVTSTSFSNPQFSITFSKDMDNASVTNPQNYTLVDASGNTVTGSTSGFSGIVDGAGHPATVVFNHTTYVATVTFGGTVPSGTYSLKLTGLMDATVLNNALATVSLPLSVTSTFKLSSAYANAAGSATSLLVTFSHPIATSGTGSALLATNYYLDLPGNGTLTALPAGTFLTASGTNGVTFTFPSAVAYTTSLSKVYAQNNVADSTGTLISVAGVSAPILAPGSNVLTASNIRNIKLLSPSMISFEVTQPVSAVVYSDFLYGGNQFETATYANQTLSDGTYGAVVYLSASTANFNTYVDPANGELMINGKDQTLTANLGAITPVNGTANAALSLYNSGANTVADVVAPTILSAKTVDANANGKIDGVKVTFSEPVNMSSLTASTFTINDGYAISSVTPVTNVAGVVYSPAYPATPTATNTFVLNVGEKLVADGGVLPTLTLANAVSDPSGNVLSAGSTVSTTDGVDPVVVSAVATDATHVTVTFDEPLAAGTVILPNFGGTTSPSAVSYTAGATTAVVTVGNETVGNTLTVSTSVTDTAGNPLLAAYTKTF